MEPKTYEIQINWSGGVGEGDWVTVHRGFRTRDQAEWATAQWKQHNNCTGDPFRVVETAPEPEYADGGSDGGAQWEDDTPW